MLALFLVSLFSLIAVGIPIGMCLVGTAVVLGFFGPGVSPQIITQGLVGGIDNFSLLAIPFFMLASEIMNKGGISSRIVGFANAIYGHGTGGIGYVAVLSSMIFAGVSGSAVADTTAVGSVILPIMKKDGYNVHKSTALVCASGCIGPIIPPSVPLIMYGVIAEVSIAKLFLGGIIPGVLIGVALMIAWYIYSRKHHLRKSEKSTFRQILVATKSSIWALLLPFIIMGTIISGVVTPTEASVVAVVYAFVVAKFVYKELRIGDMPEILVSAAKDTSTIMLVVGGAMAAAYFITIAHIPELLSSAITSVTDNVYGVIFLINILLLLVGCVMDMGPSIIILTPILLPLVVSYGLSPIWFGVIMTVNLCIGLATPPVGNVLYAGCGLSKIEMADLSKAIFPFVIVMVVVLFLISYFPNLVLIIPNLV